MKKYVYLYFCTTLFVLSACEKKPQDIPNDSFCPMAAILIYHDIAASYEDLKNVSDKIIEDIAIHEGYTLQDFRYTYKLINKNNKRMESVKDLLNKCLLSVRNKDIVGHWYSEQSMYGTSVIMEMQLLSSGKFIESSFGNTYFGTWSGNADNINLYNDFGIKYGDGSLSKNGKQLRVYIGDNSITYNKK